MLFRSCIRSNPKFGRGCTWTSLAAHHLADLLAADMAPEERLRCYELWLEQQFRADWETMRRIDRATETAFEVASGRRRKTIGDRLSGWFDDLVKRAVLSEPEVFREVWSGYHGFTGMSDWLRRPQVWWRLARAAVSRRDRPLQSSLRARPTREQLAGVGAA